MKTKERLVEEKDWLPDHNTHLKYIITPDVQGVKGVRHRAAIPPDQYYVLPYRDRNYLVLKPEPPSSEIEPGEILGVYERHFEATPWSHSIYFRSIDIKTRRKIYLNHFKRQKL